MFTGLVIEMGEVVSLTKRNAVSLLVLKADKVLSGTGLGDSISINGTCLTVVGIKGNALTFDLSNETLKTTNLGQLKVNDKVNLEPSLRLDSKLGGHFVTGHIDGVGSIKSKAAEGDIYKIVIKTQEKTAGFLVERGSVAVDGISLTVIDVFKDGFSVVIIPHTAQMTTLGFKTAGDSVNIEVDILGKYVSKFTNKEKNESFMQTLVNEGFV